MGMKYLETEKSKNQKADTEETEEIYIVLVLKCTGIDCVLLLLY